MNVQRLVVGPLATNCYLVRTEPDGPAVLVDAPFAVDPLLSAAKQLGSQLTHILLTHRHFDHLLGAEKVRELTGAQIYIPERDADGLRKEEESAAALMGFAGMQTPAEPDRLLRDGETFACGKLEFTLLETPGHTAGGGCYLCGDVLFTGDTLFDRGVGRTDLPGGNEGLLAQSLARLRDLPGDYQFCPGHGGTSTLNIQRACNPYLLYL